jgi:D-alanyl-lipoteichoic acid acyltransferase DltB (MBOAT superfamily)
LHQFKEQHYFNYQKTVSGLKLMTLGSLKKTVIADRSAEFANLVYNNIHNYSGWQLIVATIFFAFQIYFDFSGYSDIARGAARIMGFELMINFKNPYNAQSITEFWQRWHISLSSWFKDYVYIPLGGSRVSSLKNMRNVMIVFLLSGLWHGASWTYVFWGGLNGLYLIIEKNIFSLLSQKIPPLISSARLLRVKIFFNKLIMFLFVCFAWILFRANSLQDAGYIITHLFTGLDMFTQIINIGYVKQHILLGRGILNFSIAILFIFIIETAQRSAESAGQEPEDILNNRKWYFRWMVYYLILSSILLFGLFNQESFIYFQF